MPSIPEADLEHVLAHTRGLWEPLRGSHLFVTGGTGFFGRWLLESFAFANQRLDLGAQMTVLTRDPVAFKQRLPEVAGQSCLTFVKGDVTDFTLRQVRGQLPAGHPGTYSFVIHAATEASAQLNENDPLRMIDTIVAGTRRTLDFAAECGAHRFLFTSSGAVYGAQPPDVTHVSEEYSGGPDCNNPRSAYGEAKRLAELLCACYSGRGIEALIARCFAFVGPGLPLDIHFAVGNFIRDSLNGGPIRIGGDGTPCRSYLYAADLAIWLWHILFRATPNRPYNVGSDASLSIAELAALVAESSGEPVEVCIARPGTPDAPPSRYVPSTCRAASELGLENWIPLPEALHRTFAWNRAGAPALAPAVTKS